MSSRLKTREQMTVTVDKEVLKNFKEHCNKRLINKSRLLEKLVIDYMLSNEGDCGSDFE